MKSKFALIGLVALAAGVFAGSPARATTPAIEQRVEQMLSQLTPEEKIQLIAGVNGFYTKDIPHINLPGFKMSDGPVGSRNDGASTAYPAGVLLAATWDPEIAKQEGEALGRDCRARGDHFILGPGVNICRVAQNGRNFEYLGEDPFLAATIAPAYIQGVQLQGVAACVKHYACNNQETNRGEIDTIVDERTMQEIYLPAFEAAVKVGHVRSIMASYNRINGFHATANKYLETDVLRTQWGFDGICVSDWGAVHDTLGPINAGCDLEMPAGQYFNENTIAPLLANGQVTQATIDEKVRRLLRVAVEMNWLDRPQHLPSIPRNNPQNNAAALAVAREGIVLLKNTNSLLPLDRTKVKSVAVFGDAHSYIAGGGSSYTSPTHGKPIIDAIEAIAGNVRILDIQPWDWESQPLSKLAKASAYESLSAAFYNSSDLTGAPALKRNETTIDYDWKSNLPATGITSDKFSVRWTGIIKPAKSGPYVFATRSDDGSRVKLDGKTIVDNWRDQAAHSEASTVTLEANRTYQLIVEYYNAKGDASMQFAYVAKVPAVTDEQRAAAAAADAAVVCVHTGEAEGYDRPYHLDAGQEKLIRDVAAINPRTIVILQAGGNVGMKPWIDSAAALIDAWYPGQEGGQAIAEILFGDVNPSGHLPDTFEQEWSDSPAYGHYPGEDGKTDKVKYAEGIYVGYRWYDKNKIEPRFPFGFGLSYTTFEMKSLKPIMAGDQMSVSVDVTNTGSREGATIAELYVRPPANQSVDRPAQELKGFARVELKPGETKTVTIPLNARSFSYWDVDSHDWKALAGEYEIAIGQSSRDIQATTRVIWK